MAYLGCCRGPAVGTGAGLKNPERSRRRTLSTHRLGAFSDGVLAIAITPLVLDITVRPPGGLADVLRDGRGQPGPDPDRA